MGLLFALLAATLSVGEAQAQTTTTYSNTTAGTINTLLFGSCISRTFTVGPNIILSDVDIGVLATTASRSEISATLTSPGGTTVTLLNNDGGSANNLNTRFDDAAATSITTNAANHNIATAPYEFTLRPEAAFSSFNNQNAAGTWTLQFCLNAILSSATFTRADLYLTAIPADISVSKTSNVTADGVSTSNPKALPGATVQYCFTITNTGPGGATNIAAQDVVPSTIIFVSGSMRSGTTCATATITEDDNSAGADEADPYGVSISGNIISASTASLANAASFAIAFNATVN